MVVYSVHYEPKGRQRDFTTEIAVWWTFEEGGSGMLVGKDAVEMLLGRTSLCKWFWFWKHISLQNFAVTNLANWYMGETPCWRELAHVESDYFSAVFTSLPSSLFQYFLDNFYWSGYFLDACCSFKAPMYKLVPKSEHPSYLSTVAVLAVLRAECNRLAKF